MFISLFNLLTGINIILLNIGQSKGESFIDSYYYVLRGQANESFGYSLAPVSINGIDKLVVGAPRSDNSFSTSSNGLGGFFACNLDAGNCGENLASGLREHAWKIGNLGLSVASTFGNGLPAKEDSVLVCDPRARVRMAGKVAGMGVCYAFRPGQYSSYGAISYLPKLFDRYKTPVPPMLFAYSASSLPRASAYAFGIPYLLLGFGGVLYSSDLSSAPLNRTAEPLLMWGHSYVGGFRTNYLEQRYATEDMQFDRFLPDLSAKHAAQLQRQLFDKKILNYGCSGFAVATAARLVGPSTGATGGFDLVEGSPCVPDLAGLRAASFSEGFITDYVEASRRWRAGSIGGGVVRLYRVAAADDAPGSVCWGRRGVEGSGDALDSVRCFGDSDLRATLIGPAFAGRFGHALLAIDLNSDGWDDLLVSAPCTGVGEAAGGGGGGGARIHGVVFVYINKGSSGGYLPSLADHRLEFPSCATAAPDSPESVICSAASSSELWLGWSLANLGDVDLDGYADFAIGAPLTRGGGAVLIYRGAADGRPRHSQTLINTVANGFGESLSKGADFDGSGYPDLMIGAPRHGPGAVYFYPARYVVRLAIGEGGVDPGLPLDGTSPPGVLRLRVWLNFTQQNDSLFKTDSEKPTYSVDLQFFIDTAVSPNGNGRFAAQGLGPNNTLRLSSGTPQLYTLNLVYTAGVSLESDTDSPLLIEAAWWNRSPKPRSDGVRPLDSRVTLRSAPLIRGIGSQEGTRFRLSEMKWNHGCRESWCQTTVTLDCESNITRQADTGSLEILVDSRATPVEVKCRIAVSDEPAYGAYLLVSYNSEAFSLTSSLEKSTSSEFRSAANYTESLLIGNPVRPDGRGVEARLLFKPFAVGPDMAQVGFDFSVITRSRISPTGSRTRASLSAGVRTAVSVTLESLFTESTVYYNQRSVGFNAFDGSAYKLSRQFPRLSVTLSSQAGAYLPVSYLVLHWPLETRPEPGEQHGKYLTYWQTLPYIAVRGSKSNNATAATEVTCDADQVAGVLNPLQLKPDSVDAFAAAGAAEAATASPRTAGSAATRIVPVSLATGIAASAGQTPGPLTDEGQPDSVATPSAAQCTRRHRFNFTYTCGNTRCLPVVCRLGELSARMEPLRLAFVTVAYKYTFVEDHMLCTSVNIVPSVQWIPAPEYADRIVAKRVSSLKDGLPVLQSFNSDKPPPEEMDPLTKVLIYGGGALLGAAILGFIILLLALCTPFFQRRRREAREQQAAVAATAEAKNNLLLGDYEDAGAVGTLAGLSSTSRRAPTPPPPKPPLQHGVSTVGSPNSSLLRGAVVGGFAVPSPSATGRRYRFDEDETYR
ncbi:hypothetical protein BOX15_Mlig029767g2 [Macrostomum lignano]|uniref:Integrin alpha-2 domain-containing protein n=1 Tax=Macrostomum lignano TaxID=282301 RepID=A0A267H771_9PLAT|nr:hypothetical protein BOX15_Mlig029767g2 [Macrostomum lignano]